MKYTLIRFASLQLVKIIFNKHYYYKISYNLLVSLWNTNPIFFNSRCWEKYIKKKKIGGKSGKTVIRCQENLISKVNFIPRPIQKRSRSRVRAKQPPNAFPASHTSSLYLCSTPSPVIFRPIRESKALPLSLLHRMLYRLASIRRPRNKLNSERTAPGDDLQNAFPAAFPALKFRVSDLEIYSAVFSKPSCCIIAQFSLV